jgi:hypothetical protein
MRPMTWSSPRSARVRAACLTVTLLLVALWTAYGTQRTSHAAAQDAKERPVALDFDPGMDWLNTAKAVSLADLKGRIVLLDFWTLC